MSILALDYIEHFLSTDLLVLHFSFHSLLLLIYQKIALLLLSILQQVLYPDTTPKIVQISQWFFFLAYNKLYKIYQWYILSTVFRVLQIGEFFFLFPNFQIYSWKFS